MLLSTTVNLVHPLQMGSIKITLRCKLYESCLSNAKSGVVQTGRVFLLAESNLELGLYRSKWKLSILGVWFIMHIKFLW